MARKFNAKNLREAAARIGDETGYSIAKRTGLSESTVSRLFSGLTQPRTETQDVFMDVYNLHIDKLMTDDSEQVAA